MRYILLVLLLAFGGLSCQSITSKKQARKGWKRVDQEWFAQQAAAKDQKMKSNRTPSQVEKGQFICEFMNKPASTGNTILHFDKIVMDWLNTKCDSDKVISSVYVLGNYKEPYGPWTMMCCVAK